MTGRSRVRVDRRRAPKADGSHRSCARFAPAQSWLTDWSFRNLRARGRDPLHFLEPPKYVGYCRRAEKPYCPRHWQTLGWSWSSPREADSAKVPADESSAK